MRWRTTTVMLSAWLLLLPASVTADPAAQETGGTLVFSLRTWEGEYTSQDVPGGVKTTATQGAIYTIAAGGGEPKLVAKSGKSDDYPWFSLDGRWIYYQSNDTGRWHVYRSKPDGSARACLTSGDRLGKEWKDA